MIVVEKFGENLVRHYSNKCLRIKQLETGLVYDEAIDQIPCRYTYEETDDIIEIGEV